MEEKVASFQVPAIGVVSELKLGALKVIGTHNYYNAAVAALSVLGLDLGIDTEAISSTIEKLRVPPHRMQLGKWKWVVILFFRVPFPFSSERYSFPMCLLFL